MKKNQFFIYLISLQCFLLLIFSANCFSTEMYAEKYDAFIEGSPADHVYACLQGGDCYAYHGGKSGGTNLSNTRGDGDSANFKCIATKGFPCKLVYGVEGVCHQEANRMLSSSNKTVREARGYWIFWPLYWTYGKYSSGWWLCKFSCD